jgi:hypothetical protein
LRFEAFTKYALIAIQQEFTAPLQGAWPGIKMDFGG